MLEGILQQDSRVTVAKPGEGWIIRDSLPSFLGVGTLPTEGTFPSEEAVLAAEQSSDSYSLPLAMIGLASLIAVVFAGIVLRRRHRGKTNLL